MQTLIQLPLPSTAHGLVGLGALLLLGAPAHAAKDLDPTPSSDSPDAPVAVESATEDQDEPTLEERVEALENENKGLRNELDAIGGELERFVLTDLVPEVGESIFGFGPAASKVYQVENGISIGGYGETVFQFYEGDSKSDQFDNLRAVLYFGYKFSDSFVFNSEIEIEHGTTSETGSVSTEFAYLDWLACDTFGLRGGLVLVPMGFINELHEPTTFLSANRPEIERRIMPSTWRENGVGAFGSVGDVDYRAYVINGLDASGFAANGLRGGRQKGSRALAEDLAFVARADYTGTPGLTVGGSVYMGDSGQGQTGLPDASTSIHELHVEYKNEGWRARALYAHAEVDDVAQLNTALGLAGANSIGEELDGFYLELGYDLWTRWAPEREGSLTPFVRYEAFDTQASVPGGFASMPSTDESILTVGIAYQPHDQIILKLDFEDWDEGADRLNIGLGYTF